MTSTRQGIEVELKYRVRDAEAAARLGALRTLGGLRVAGRPRQVQVEDRYLDTADGALSRAGYAARLRRGPRMTILSVKASNEAASALHRREELEGPADLSLDPHAWPSSAARSLVLEHAGDAPLIEVVTIRQLRRARTFSGDAHRGGADRRRRGGGRRRAHGRSVPRARSGAQRRATRPAWPTSRRSWRSIRRSNRSRPPSWTGRSPHWRAADGPSDPGRAPHRPRRRSRRARARTIRRKQRRPARARTIGGRRRRRPPTRARTIRRRPACPGRSRRSRRGSGARSRRRSRCRSSRRYRRRLTRRTSAPGGPRSLSARRPGSPATTCSRRRAARSSASTSPGCWPARRGPERAARSRISTACASRRAGCGRHGASSAMASGSIERGGCDDDSARWQRVSERCATSTS